MTGKRLPNSPSGIPFSGNFSDGKLDQDRYLPIANVSRIMKKSLPANAKISKEAKETVQECVSEFISFITGEASDKCQREKRKTVNGDDLLWAMTTLGFENYVGPLKDYLNKYRESEEEKNSCIEDIGENLEKNNPICLQNFSSGNYHAFGNMEVINNNVKSRQGVAISDGGRFDIGKNYEFDGINHNHGVHEW
ncbi:hypothetical protein BUALT_Bualt11G0010800 [Buddleja alternifolia]|uniref:Transcription factor CBF/NF-Y/archaeal histone domain-containing protein n=1 Tax=Buddleja alternifolia TaxID=168488 RepID=A0AAV6WRX5_9LAMI|nr:hypothetical protein BUALT_Bualt11G0010800 [Buddleja alternifolia]